MYLDFMVYHTVLLGCDDGTAPGGRWSLITGNVFVLRKDIHRSLMYAMRALIGVRRGSGEGSRRVLIAFCAMDGRMLDTENFAAPSI